MVALTVSVLTVILISAMCSLFEAVLYSVPISHIETLVQAGSKTGKILQGLREKVDQPIAAILSLNTISNTAGAAIAGALAANVLGSAWLGLFSAFFTLAILVFAEVIPKTVGVVYGKALAELIARPLQILVWSFRPLTWLLGLITDAVAGQAATEQVSEAELVAMAQRGMRTGILRKDEAEVIKNILSLEDKTVSDVMTPRTVLFALPDEITVEEVGKMKGIYSHSRIPVYSDNLENITGIVLRRDLLMELAEDRLDTKISSLIQPVDFVFERASLDKVLKKALDHRQHLFVVIGEYGDIEGVITLEDILEEILGQEIVDESDSVVDMRVLAEKRRKQLLEESGVNPTVPKENNP